MKLSSSYHDDNIAYTLVNSRGVRRRGRRSRAGCAGAEREESILLLLLWSCAMSADRLVNPYPPAAAYAAKAPVRINDENACVGFGISNRNLYFIFIIALGTIRLIALLRFSRKKHFIINRKNIYIIHFKCINLLNLLL